MQKQRRNIIQEDVKSWFESNVQRKTQLRGFNSYIPVEPRNACEADPFHMTDFENQKYAGELLVMDGFTKSISVIPLEYMPPTADAIIEAFEKGIY